MSDYNRTIDRGDKPRRGKPVQWIVIAVGLIFASVGAGLLYNSYTFQQTAIATTGTVLSVETFRERKRDNDGNWKTTILHQPTLRYSDVDGVEREAKPSLKSSSYDFEVGSEVDLYFDPDAPHDVRINDFMSNWGFGGIFLAFGLILSSLGFFLTRRDSAGNR